MMMKICCCELLCEQKGDSWDKYGYDKSGWWIRKGKVALFGKNIKLFFFKPSYDLLDFFV